MNPTDNAALPTQTQSPPMAPDISADAATGWVDWAVVAAVLAVALWYLYRKLWAKRGGCAGCGKGSECAVRRMASPPAGGVEVKLGRSDGGGA
jgi:hypothetical protein